GVLEVPFERAQVGDRYVLERLKERGWQVGGESSGHLLCLDCHSTGDGIVAALQVLAALRRYRSSMADWVKDLTMYPQVMINVPIAADLDWKAHQGLQKAQAAVQAQLGESGRVLIRASGTEAKLRLMVEASDKALAQACAQQLADALH
ncbi:MAG: phosphoglucosamine mutase, partial [Orrella sp.]